MPCSSPIYLYRSKKGPSPLTGKTPLVPFKQGRGRVSVPCNRCIECRLERSRQWAIRCDCERQMHEENVFVTFTLRDDQLVYGGAQHAILEPRLLTLFFKRLRKHFGRQGIKYFACGEYGDKLNRPHYHAIIFGIDFKDKIFDHTENGCDYYHSHTLDYLWTHGRCIIGAVTFESAAYVARYVMKKRLGKAAEEYEKEGITPEFVRMSRRPGIGSTWFDKYEKDVFPNDHMIIRGGLKARPPKYFTQKYEATHPLDAEDLIKKRHEYAEKNWHEQEPKRLKSKHIVKLAAIKALTRKLD